MIKKDIIFGGILIILGLLTRTIFHLGSNIEFITFSGIAAGMFFQYKKFAYLIPFIILVTTDVVIGNSIIFLFTWTGFLLAPVIGSVLSRCRDNNKIVRTIIIGTGGGILSVLFFYFWTNFGVVITTSMYPNTLAGLVLSYTNALPFLMNQLVSNLIILPSFLLISSVLYYPKNLLGFMDLFRGNLIGSKENS